MDDRHSGLLQKVMGNGASQAEKEEFRALHRQRSHEVLTMPVDELFSIEPVKTDLPAKARVEPSQPCGKCGEPIMPSKLESEDGRMVCRDCRN